MSGCMQAIWQSGWGEVRELIAVLVRPVRMLRNGNLDRALGSGRSEGCGQ